MSDKLKLGECKRGLSSLIRPHYTEGLLLQDDDLTAGVTYTRELSRMMFRTLLGCGVLCGLKVSPPVLDCNKLKIGVAKGSALSCIGDPIEVSPAQTLEIDICKWTVGNELWIGLRPNEKCCAPRTAICSPDDDESPSVCTRERDGFELCAFSTRPPCSCGCAKLADPPNPQPTTPEPNLAPATPPAADAAAAAAAAAATAAGTHARSLTTEPPEEPRPTAETPCLCNQRTADDACYGKYYQGDCPCDCCDCEWIVLAKISRQSATGAWSVDHSVRRFVRPLLMRDPLVT